MNLCDKALAVSDYQPVWIEQFIALQRSAIGVRMRTFACG
jgi:hypothetical protein